MPFPMPRAEREDAFGAWLRSAFLVGCCSFRLLRSLAIVAHGHLGHVRAACGCAEHRIKSPLNWSYCAGPFVIARPLSTI